MTSTVKPGVCCQAPTGMRSRPTEPSTKPWSGVLDDWGALILADNRFGINPNKYISGLYKWVHNLFRHHNAFICAMQSLMTFSRCQQGAGETHGAGSQMFNSTTILFSQSISSDCGRSVPLSAQS
uniref:Fanconi anemia group J protein homolog n=1 Tax=Oncorhynchus gorbuscha TaxID=8017 RepID=UPI001EAEE8FA|nr:Fanconi anemia group J protein homolog [Oncorhynchus gorbuscha]